MPKDLATVIIASIIFSNVILVVTIHNWLAKEPMIGINAWIMPKVTNVQDTTIFIAPKSATNSRNRLVYLSTEELKAGQQWIE